MSQGIPKDGMELLAEYFTDETSMELSEKISPEALREVLQVLGIIHRKLQRRSAGARPGERRAAAE